jgi:murE/murF fusion protein
MRLSDLLAGVAIDRLGGALPPSEQALYELPVNELREDSRQVGPGDLFVALSGQSVDGHGFVGVAATRGALAAVVERLQDAAIPQIVVKNTAQALSLIAANRHGRPADALTLIAVTGTNGKTTTTHLIEALLNQSDQEPSRGGASPGAGARAGVIGTIAYRFGSQRWPAPLTTPTAPLLQQTLAEMRALGASHVVMEASSHALSLSRLHGVRFRVAAFTNLTQDHLDFHGDMESYFQAKLRLFHDHLLPPSAGGRAVVLIDDEAGTRIAASLPPEACLRVSLSGPAEISLRSERQTLEGTVATFQTPGGEVTLQSRLSGRFNLANLAVAVGVGIALGLSPARIAAGLAQVEGVPGRLERLGPPRMNSQTGGPGVQGPSIFVDYAHTPDALARVLSSLRALGGGDKRRGRLWVVFGCGGDRDTGKRPQMGQIAAAEADLVVVTSDNPRSEDPQAIIRMIVAGITAPGTRSLDRLERGALATARAGYFIEVDRRQAIATAIAAARPEDVVLIAGKGHEDYQIIGGNRQHFDDREEALRALLARTESSPRSSPPPSSPQISGGGGATVAANIELPLERVLSATGGRLLRGGAYRFSAVTIDSRAVIPGALFVAVRGHKQDGHQFCAQAVSAGAAGLLVDRGKAPRLPDSQAVAVIEVADTHVALGQIARAHREAPEISSKLRVVAVTGSSGKTSTKELVAAILTTHAGDPAEVLKTEGNLNNHFGVPLTLLRLRPGQRFAVIEMGMSARGEIAYLTSLARPDVGIITNVGSAHLEMLGSLDNVAAAKGELFVGLGDGSTAVFCGNPDHARVQGQALLAGATAGPGSRHGRLRAFVTRRSDAAAPSPRSAEPSPVVEYRLLAQKPEGIEVELRYVGGDGPAAIGPSRVVAQVPLVGAHQADNAALAAAAALALDVPLLLCAHGLSRVVQAKHRGQIVTIAGRQVLDDCYNANPDSTAAALRTLSALRGSARAVAVLGDMLELGADEAALHRRVGAVAAECGLSQLITVGERARHASLGARDAGLTAVHADSPQQAASLAHAATQPGDWILVKGSRGMALEHVIDSLRSQPSSGPSHPPGGDAAASTRPTDPTHGGAN